MKKYADVIVKGAKIFSGMNLPKDYEYLAVKDGKILSVGRGDSWKAFVDCETKVMQLSKDQLVVPGFHDSHLHLLMSAVKMSYVDLGDAKSEEEAAQMVKKFADANPDDPWVIGQNWYHVNWESRQLPTAASLDRYILDRPVFLANTEVHGAWVNSKALEICGITDETQNPEHGEIVRFENGKATGYLNEMAMGIAGRYAMKFEIEKEKEMVTGALKEYAACGITAVNDLRPELGYDLGQYETFYQLEQEDQLQVRVHSAASLLDDADEVMKSQDKYNGEKFRICLLKQYMDGVPTTHTAMTVDSYADKPGEHGEPICDLAVMQHQVEEAQRRGLSVKIHCCGDGAVRKALDLYENAWNKYGDTGSHHAVEHVEIVQPDDVERFQRLNVIASMQPEHMVIQVESYEENPYFEKYSAKQMKTSWIFRTLLDKGITVAFGSDCPVVGVNPLVGIYRAVTRKFDDGNPKDGMQPEQRITPEEALHCYTYNSAVGVGRQHELGTLEPGKYADLAVLDQNILICDPEKIKSAKVVTTMMNGNITYGQI